MEFIFILERQFLVIKCQQENANYCVTLVMKTVIYKSKLLGFHDFESLVFDVFLSATSTVKQKKAVFLLTLSKKIITSTKIFNLLMFVAGCRLQVGFEHGKRLADRLNYPATCNLQQKSKEFKYS